MHWSLTEPISAIEYLFMAIFVAAAVLTPARVKVWLGHTARASLRRLGRSPALGILLLSLAWNFAPLAVSRPNPSAHDELSFMLMADTFLEGRLAMPMHPMWRSFETYHVIHQPTYASKYPFFQGIVLAGGQFLFSDPIIGVKLVGALAASAVYWALAGWVRPRWALIGAVVFALHFGGFSYWSQTYFPGAAAALGGALLLGAYPRVVARPRLRDGVLMGLGLVILATTRPYEGLVLALPVAIALCVPGRAAVARRAAALAPTALIVSLGLGAIGFYNHAVTGDPLTFPYAVYTERYGYAQPLRFQSPNTDVTIEHEVMQRFLDEFEKALYEKTWTEAWRPMTRFYAAPLLLPPLLLIPLLPRDKRTRFAVVLGLVGVAGLSLTTFILPHFAAPFSALLLLLVLQCLRRLRVCRRRARWGGRFAFGVVLTTWFYAWILMTALSAMAQSRQQQSNIWYSARQRVEQELTRSGERHLVMVHYNEDHSPHEEWVYNRADIDGADVVWAREVDEVQNRAVARYYCGRHVWRVGTDWPNQGRLVKLRAPVCGAEE